MKRMVSLTLACALASLGSLARADETTQVIELGLSTTDSDTGSSRFLEYRSLPDGLIVPRIELRGAGKLNYELIGVNVLQSDASYLAAFHPGPLTIELSHAKIPHLFGNAGRTLHTETSRGMLEISDIIQSSLQGEIESATQPIDHAFLSSLVAPVVQTSSRIDLMLNRQQSRAEVSLGGGSSVDLKLSYFHEKRRGSRASGTAFGFGNVVETAEPIEYRTQDVKLAAEWNHERGLIRGGLTFNRFTNRVPFQTFDNPFRAVDSTDGRAYLAPGSASIGGPILGMVSLPPTSDSISGTAGFVFKLPKQTRISADVALSQWRQDEALMPYTTNTAVVGHSFNGETFTASDIRNLPVASFDGRINALSFSAGVTTRPISRVRLTARIRRYDLENKSARVEFPGYVRFDAVWEEIPRITVPYGYTKDHAGLTAIYDIGPASLEAGYRYDLFEREFRETNETRQGTLVTAATLKPIDWISVRASFERATREFDEYDPEHGEHASFLDAGDPANLLLLRRYDQADKDFDRIGASVQLTPGGKATIALQYLRADEDYRNSEYGLLEATNETISADVDYALSDRFNVYCYYTHEAIASFQRGRQSGGTLSTNTADDWTSRIRDKVDTLGAGATLALVPDRLNLKLDGSYQKLDGNNALDSPPGGTPDLATSISEFDDTKWLRLNAEADYKLQGGWKLVLGGLLEKYQLRDLATGGLPYYAPGGFFLVADDGDFEGYSLYTRAVYSW